MKKTSTLQQSRRKQNKKGDTNQLAAQLAPLEEQDKQAAIEQVGAALTSPNDQTDPNYGAIVVDNANLVVPQDIEDEQAKKRFLGMEPVVIVLLILFLAFIAFVAWQITLMPAAQK